MSRLKPLLQALLQALLRIRSYPEPHPGRGWPVSPATRENTVGFEAQACRPFRAGRRDDQSAIGTQIAADDGRCQLLRQLLAGAIGEIQAAAGCPGQRPERAVSLEQVTKRLWTTS